MLNFKKGNIVQLIHNCEVLEVISSNKIKVRDKERDMEFFIEGTALLKSLNDENYVKTEKLSGTDIARKLISTHGNIFVVHFIKDDGTPRTLRGYLKGVEDVRGRSFCVDLDVEDDNKIRLVDHRTIQWLIFDGVKYVTN